MTYITIILSILQLCMACSFFNPNSIFTFLYFYNCNLIRNSINSYTLKKSDGVTIKTSPDLYNSVYSVTPFLNIAISLMLFFSLLANFSPLATPIMYLIKQSNTSSIDSFSISLPALKSIQFFFKL
jgi:hypothetical protein